MSRPSPALVLASAALFISLGGPAEAARMINGQSIRASSITSKQIRNGSLAARDLNPAARRLFTGVRAGSIGSAELADNGVTAIDVGTGAIGSDEVAPNALLSEDLGTNSVQGDELAPNSVQGDELAANSVTGDELVLDSVTSGEIRDGSLTSRDFGEFTGVLPLDFPNQVPASECLTAVAKDVPGLRPNVTLEDDIVLVSAPSGFKLTVTAKATGPRDIAVTVCNPTNGNQNLGPQQFRFVALDVNG